MPRHGLLRVVGQINPLQGHSDPIGDVREVASMEGRDRVESLGGLEVAAGLQYLSDHPDAEEAFRTARDGTTRGLTTPIN
jgi:hypothetical protein